MSTAGRPDASAPAESLAAACRDAGFVRLVASADGDALAALGVLVDGLRSAAVPFQTSVAHVPRPPATDADVTVTLGATGGDVAVTEDPLSPTAYAAARELGADPDAVLALAGAVAAGATPGEDAPLYEAAEAALTRRPGLAVPVADVADGLAHTTLAHLPFSGDAEATTAELAGLDLPPDLDDDARRRLASFAGLQVAVDEAGTERGARAVERLLRPYAGGPFETLGGYADVLEAVAREAPGTGIALALGNDVRTAALDAWRAHAAIAHEALRTADTARYDGCVVVRADGPVDTVARLARDFRSPEPVVLAVGGGDAAACAVETDVARAIRVAATETGAAASGTGATGYARGVDDDQAFVTAFREAL